MNLQAEIQIIRLKPKKTNTVFIRLTTLGAY